MVEQMYDGEALLNEVYDLMRHRLPLLSPEDAARPYLSALLPQLGVALGRPALVAVPAEQQLA